MHLITEIEYEDEQINIANETKFLGLYLIIIFPGKHTLKVLRIT